MASSALLVAHRSGNTVETAHRDEDRADVIELDVHVHRGRVVVRHEKVLRPTSRLWERWYLLPAGTPVPTIDEVLDVLDENTPLLLDLKCFTRRAGRRIRRAVPGRRPLIVSCRTWWVLGAFGDRPDTTLLRSCGSDRQLRLATWWPGLGPRRGLVVHQRLLDPDVVRDLRRRTPEVFTWAVTTRDRARELVEAGVTGLIVDDLSIAWPPPEAP